LLLEGAHWTLNPGVSAPQHMLLHSLGFYVAAAAARSTSAGSPASGLLLLQRGAHAATLSNAGSSGSSSSSSLGCWDASSPVDLHGFSLSAAGYHCLAQEGGLSVKVRPAAAAAGGEASGML
jgi:hypothetical protein